MDEYLKEALSRIDEYAAIVRPFTVKSATMHKMIDALLAEIQTDNGQTFRECFPLRDPWRLISLCKACGIWRQDMTAYEALQDLPGKTGRAVFLKDPDGAESLSRYIYDEQ